MSFIVTTAALFFCFVLFFFVLSKLIDSYLQSIKFLVIRLSCVWSDFLFFKPCGEKHSQYVAVIYHKYCSSNTYVLAGKLKWYWEWTFLNLPNSFIIRTSQSRKIKFGLTLLWSLREKSQLKERSYLLSH